MKRSATTSLLAVPCLALLTLVLSGSLTTRTPDLGRVPDTARPGLLPMERANLSPHRSAEITYGDAVLRIDTGSVDEELIIEMTELGQADLPELGPGMTNATGQVRRGYRFLPHDTKFERPIEIALPYEPALIPAGFTAQDLRTFYFDEDVERWKRLEWVRVDTRKRVVVSLTDHFTDMVNAAVAVPDHPGLLSYTPTEIQDLKAADPGAEINLVAAPTANSLGEARLSYPLVVPPGRLGMQPELSVTYNSSAGNGWLGVGWSLSPGSVTIDTRWGVPRYSGAKETETYVLDGAQLTPVAHRGDLEPRAAEKVFHTRVEGEFRRIIRHGSHPTNYWWEVVATNGTRFFYGGDPVSNGPRPQATLRDGAGNVFHWALVEVRDLHGNGIRYQYDRVTDSGLPSGSVDGYELYPRSINYTQSDGAPGPYTVTFVRDSELTGYARRSDVTIDCRGGFKRVTAELLARIDIEYEGDLIRQYTLDYVDGAFEKRLLASITQHGEDGTVFHTHEFDYYDEIRNPDGTFKGFRAPREWDTGDDGIINIALLGQGTATALSGATGFSAGAHSYFGFNPGPLAPPFLKTNSFGAKVGGSFSQTNGVLAMLDINGDGLPDKVFQGDPFDSTAYFFRLNRSGPDSDPNLPPPFGPKRALPTLPHISRENSIQVSAGAEAYPGSISAVLNTETTFTNDKIFFSDVNGDGLPDLVDDKDVLFNHLDANGVPTFDDNSANTDVPIGEGAVNATELLEDYEEDFQRNVDNFPLHDTIRRWTAPYPGQIAIAGTVTLVAPTNAESTDDGVRVAIQHDGSELWSARIEAGDHTPKAPIGVGSISVQAGDHIYFRVQSVFDGSNDEVSWEPEITYPAAGSLTDANGLDPYRFQSSEDYVLGGRRGICVAMPLDGTIRLVGDVMKTGVTTDDVTLQAKHFRPSTGTTTLLLDETLTWDQIGSIPLMHDWSVDSCDVLELRIATDTPIDLSRITWTPELFYIDSPSGDVQDAEGNYIIQLEPAYDMDVYARNDLTAPQEAWVAPNSGSVEINTDGSAVAGTDAELVFTVKRLDELVAKHTVVVDSGAVSNLSFSVDVTMDDELYFDFATRDPELHGLITDLGVSVTLNAEPPEDAPVAFHCVYRTEAGRLGRGLYAQPYRGWAYTAYNGNRDRAEDPIDESLLTLPPNPEDYDPCTADAYVFYPSPQDALWRGPDDAAWFAPSGQASSRLGTDQIDVPRPGNVAGGRAVNRLARTFHISASAGLPLIAVSATTCEPTCTVPPPSSRSVLDYMDLNGDRFPDIVGKSAVQYTTLVGGLEGESRTVAGLTPVSRTRSAVASIGPSGNPVGFSSNGKGEVGTSGKNTPKGNQSGSQMPTLTFLPTAGTSRSEQDLGLVDLNGDGLPDRVRTDGSDLMVSFNLGYAFAAEERWGEGRISSGTSQSLSFPGPGFNVGDFSFAGGTSLSLDQSRANQTLADVNGDGLPDLVSPDALLGVPRECVCPIPPLPPAAPFLPFLEGDHLKVSLNTGTGFGPETAWPGAEEVSISENMSLGAGAFITIPIGPICVVAASCYVIINPGVYGSFNMARQTANLVDVNGDGMVDYVRSSEDGSMDVALNPTGRTNLLREVRRPLGATIAITYQRDGNTTDHPESRWTMSRVEVFDGFIGDGANIMLTTYRYENGQQDRLEREFYGYGRVIEEQRDTVAGGDPVYRSIVREYLNDSFYTKGLLTRVLLQDASGNPYLETENSYLVRDVETGHEPAGTASTTATLFPQLARVDQRFYEGTTPAMKSTFITYEYDDVGNIVELFDARGTGSGDDVRAIIGYSACEPSYVVDQPVAITVTADSDGTPLRHRQATIDCDTGKVLQVREFLADGTFAQTDLQYFANGNLERIVGPENASGQRYELEYEYDAALETHVARISDSFGYLSTVATDPKHGQPVTTIDANRNRIDTTYDEFGRAATIRSPYHQDAGPPSVEFEYHPHDTVPWALTRHRDDFVAPAAGDGSRVPTDPSGLRAGAPTIDTVLFTDGLKRVVQSKRDGTIHVAPGQSPEDVMIISGQTNFDFVGRAVEQYYPITEPLGTAGIISPNVDTVSPTVLEFDVLDRNVRATNPSGTMTTLQYGFGPDRLGTTQFETVVTDPNGVQRKTYHEINRLVTAVQELLDGGTEILWTSYSYNPLGEVSETVDDQNNVTRYAYDMLGRLMAVDHPDAGETEYVYDTASNLVRKVTANLRSRSERIDYDYDFNRLVGIRYPDFPENDVSYLYGAPGAQYNRAGRISLIADESGTTERAYGLLGEITREVKTIASDTQGQGPGSAEVYTTDFTYDTFGRLRELTYPDGEALTYGYDSGGLVRSAMGTKSGFDYHYVRAAEYDKFGQRAFIEVGNGVRSSYRYREDNRRLETLAVSNARGTFQNLNYSYDAVGNVLQLTNDVPVSAPSDFGGPTTQVFEYDDLYRLVEAAGSYEFSPRKLDEYGVSFDYDTIHNLRAKSQLHEIVQPSGQRTPQHETSYDWTYGYGGTQPHAVTHLDDRTLSYDANGNQTGWTDDGSGQNRAIVWDEENRIQSVFDNGHEKTYKYDHENRRVMKEGPQGETAYVNRYFTARNRERGTKHIYLGVTRYASKLVKQSGNSNGRNPFEKDQFFYHPDHLGSSQYITDANGEIYEHLEYFPFGEIWVEEASATQDTPYLFTGKELDEETGLYYFDPRYQEPRQGQFLAVDPLASNGPASASIDPQSLNPYGYARNNPLRIVDPSIGVAVDPGIEGIRNAVLGNFNPSSIGGSPAVAGGDGVAVVRASGGGSPGDGSDERNSERLFKLIDKAKQQAAALRSLKSLRRKTVVMSRGVGRPAASGSSASDQRATRVMRFSGKPRAARENLTVHVSIDKQALATPGGLAAAQAATQAAFILGEKNRQGLQNPRGVVGIPPQRANVTKEQFQARPGVSEAVKVGNQIAKELNKTQPKGPKPPAARNKP